VTDLHRTSFFLLKPRQGYNYNYMYPFVICSVNSRLAASDCRVCAERKLIRVLLAQATRAGVQPAYYSSWIHRKHGDLIVCRTLHDGNPGISLPCVICRKALDRWAIQWRAHIGRDWVRSTDLNLPQSKPTNKQKRNWDFLRE